MYAINLFRADDLYSAGTVYVAVIDNVYLILITGLVLFFRHTPQKVRASYKEAKISFLYLPKQIRVA